jgi:hypothetical protein
VFDGFDRHLDVTPPVLAGVLAAGQLSLLLKTSSFMPFFNTANDLIIGAALDRLIFQSF